MSTIRFTDRRSEACVNNSISVKCPLCGAWRHQMISEIFCSRCDTAHCAECYKINGCAIHGCRELSVKKKIENLSEVNDPAMDLQALATSNDYRLVKLLLTAFFSVVLCCVVYFIQLADTVDYSLSGANSVYQRSHCGINKCFGLFSFR